jgi:hypothetical protein
VETKFVEIRDARTCIHAIAMKFGTVADQENWALRCMGFGLSPEEQNAYVLLYRVTDNSCHYDPCKWGDSRTMLVSHRWLIDNWGLVTSGDVVDVEFLLGETRAAKTTERGKI